MRKFIKSLIILNCFILLICSPLIYLSIYKTKIKAIESPNIQYIYLDPGHGGKDGGGIGINGVYEKEINLNICYILKRYLENSGYNVKLTRYDDYDLASKNSTNRKYEDINKRIELIDNDNTLLYLSIHCNMYPNCNVKGAQTFYDKKDDNNKLLAEIIQDKFVNILNNTKRVSKSISDKYLINNVKTNGCLIEVGFLSNIEEMKLLCDLKYQDKVSYCIYIGIIEFLAKNNNF